MQKVSTQNGRIKKAAEEIIGDNKNNQMWNY
jgi:hypothetical protein